MIRSAILALGCVSCCLHGASYGQLYRQATRTNTLSSKVTATRTTSTLKLIPQATQVQPDVGGTFISLSFATNVDAYAFVSLYKVGGALPPGTDSMQWSDAGKQHQVQFVNLEADTDYEVRIEVLPTSPGDYATPAPIQFPFRTLERHVFVALKDVFVFDDADWDNAGDLRFNVQIGDEYADFGEAGNSWDFLTFFASIDSGTGINLPQSEKPYYLYQNDVHSTTLKIAVSANEQDSSVVGISFRPPAGDYYLGTGCDSRNEWNSGYKLIAIGDTFVTPGAGNLHQSEALVRDFEIHVAPSQHADLSYSLTGQLVVAYW